MDESACVVEQIVFAVKLGTEENVVTFSQSTPGVSLEDKEEIQKWATRIELFDGVYDSNNLFSFSLPGSAIAIGRLVPVKDRGNSESHEFFFQCLVVDLSTFFVCGANPTILLHLALNTTHFVRYTPDLELQSFVLDEEQAYVKKEELLRVCDNVGARTLAVLIQAVLENKQTCFISDYSPFLLISCVYSLLPVLARSFVTFSSGVRFKNDASTRLIGVMAQDKTKRSRCSKAVENMTYLDLRDVAINGEEYVVDNPWCVLLENALTANSLFFLLYFKMATYYLMQRRRLGKNVNFQMTPQDVVELGKRWLGTFKKFRERIANGENVEEYDDSLLLDFSDLDWSEENIEEINSSLLRDVDWGEEEQECDWHEKEDYDPADDWKLHGEISDEEEFSDEEAKWDESDKGDNGLHELQFFFEQVVDPTADEKNVDLDQEYVARIRAAREEELAEARESSKKDANDSRDDSFGDSKKNLSGEGGPVPTDQASNVFKRLSELDVEPIDGWKNELLVPGGERKTPGESRSEGAGSKFAGIDLSPFATLSAEFPARNVELRKLNVLIADSCKGKNGAKDELRLFWRALTKSGDRRFLDRIRDVYASRFQMAIYPNYESEEEQFSRFNRLFDVIDVFEIIMS